MPDLDIKIIVALIAVVVSFVGLIITKEQKTSEFRQKWIDEIRFDIANLMGCLSQYTTKWIVLENTGLTDVRKAFLKDNISIINEIYVLLYRIELRLNPIKDKSLIDVLKHIEEMIQSPKKMDHDSLFEDLTGQLKSQSHEMLKKEWTRVKDGEPIFRTTKYILGLVLLVSLYGISVKVLCP